MVIVILGVLASLVLGYQLRLRNEQRLIAGSKALIGWLDEVRRRSIQQSAPCTVTVTAASGTMAAAAANACGAFPPFSLANAVPTANDLELCVALADPFAAAGNCPGGAASADLVFTPRGTTTTSALLQLHITNHAPNRCVAVIAPLGLLRVGRVDGGFCDWNRVS